MTRRLALVLSLALAACSGSGSVQKGSSSSAASTGASSGTTGVIAGPTGPSTSSGSTTTSSASAASSATSGSGTSGTSSASSAASSSTSAGTTASSASSTGATTASSGTTGSTGTTGPGSTSSSSSGATTGPASTASSSTASSSSSSGSTGTTGAALQVTSVTSSQGAGPIDDNVVFTVTFNEPVDPTSLSVNSSGGACTGSLQVSGDNFGTCLALTAPVLGSGNASASFGPNAPLPSGTTYLVRITSAVRSAGHVALGGEVTAGTFFTRLGDVTNLQPTGQLQSITLGWQAPSSSRLQGVQVSWAEHGTANFTSPVEATSPFTATGLLPFTSYDFRVVAIDVDGQPSSGATLTASTLFSGSTADWLPSQQLAGAAGHAFYVAWSASDLVVGISASDADGGAVPHPLSTGDALWLAVDTDPASDATGEVRTTTQGSNDVIWPFRANYVVELKVTGAGTTVTNLRDGVAQTWSSASFDGYEGEVTELRVPRAALFSPASARLALLAVNTGNGFAFDLAPANPGATDTLAYFASLTASLAPGASLWDPSQSVSGSPLAQAPGLVRLQVAGAPGAGPVKVRGSLHPLSYTLGDSDYRLADAGSGNLAGAFNLGGATGELFFQLDQADAGEPGFGSKVDRVFTLGGGPETLPTLTFGQAYSASHAFQLTFRCQTGGSPSELRGNVSELGNFASAGAPVTFDPDAGVATVTVGLSSHDFTQTPLQFKVFYANQSYEGGSDHTLNDDVINSRVVTWSAGDGQGF